MKKLLLVDGNSMIFRAYYATCYGRMMTTSNGIATNAVYGFNMMLSKARELIKPDYILVAFDYGKKTFRHELYQDYKGGRKETPDELKVQFPIVREMLDAQGIKYFEYEGIEADDIIGSSAKKFSDYDINILTSDHDMLQLIDDNCSVWLMKKGLSDIEEMTVDSLYETYHLKPLQIIDLKGLMGDSSDNIPGISGIGEKTAIKLLEKYQSVENVISNVNEIQGKLGERISSEVDNALLSKALATINTSFETNLCIDDFCVKQNDQQLYDFYQKYEMNSFLKNLNIAKKETKKVSYQVVDKVSQELLKENSCLIFDYDFDNYHYATLYGLAVSNGLLTEYISINDISNDHFLLEYLNSNIKKITYDSKLVFHLLKNNNIKFVDSFEDIKLMAFLIDNLIDNYQKLSDKYNLSNPDLKEEIFGKINKPKLADFDLEVKYSCALANDLHSLFSALLEDLKSLNMTNLYYDIELPLAYVLFDMETVGFLINQNTLDEISKKTNNIINELSLEIYQLANQEFNINSPKQLAEVLFDNLKLPANKKRSTSVEVLEKLKNKHPIINKLIDYRKYQKLYSTYAEGLKKYIDSDSKIHTQYNQTITQTGRLSSTEPNLQNISVRSEEGREIRKAFIPEKDCVLVSCDYSQVELRVLASMANVSKLIKAFKDNIDIHTSTACEIFNVNAEEVTTLMRRQAKAVNFGIVYGISSFGLAEQIEISNNEAQIFIDKYFESYPEIKVFMNKVISDCQKNGYVETLLHRRRYIPEINDKNYMICEFGKRAAMNSPIQGTAADLIKIAMIRIFRRLENENLKSKIILQIHDEVVLNVLESELDQVSLIIKEEMLNAMKLQVPLVSDLVIGKTWYEAK